MASTDDKLTYFARAGLVAKGLVYCIFGWLAFQAAFGEGGIPDRERIAQELGSFAVILLWAVAFGLMLYGSWRAAEAFGYTDGQLDGDKKKEVAQRLGAAGSAISNIALGIFFAITAAGAMGLGSGGGGGGGSSTSGLLDSMWGRIAVGVVGLGIIAAGISQFVKAYKETYMRDIHPSSPKAQRALRLGGKIAFSARGLIFLIIGGGLIVSALQAHQTSYTSLGGALRKLSEQSYGTWLLAAAGIGLIAYGIICWAMSCYVRVHRSRPDSPAGAQGRRPLAGAARPHRI